MFIIIYATEICKIRANKKSVIFDQNHIYQMHGPYCLYLRFGNA